MAAHDPDVRALSCKIAAIERHHPNSDTSDLRRDLRAASLADRIRREAEFDPPLSSEQRSRLAALLLKPSGGDSHAA
jgi:hypothetical protein